MSLGYESPQLARLNVEYRRICDDFDNNLITASEARTQVLGLLYVDELGDAWVVDTKRSGRDAHFVRKPRTDRRPSQLEIPQLAQLNREYRRICDDFDNNLITASEARAFVHGLIYVDERGDAWVVDTKRSGRNAHFIREPRAKTAPPKEIPREISPPLRKTVSPETEIPEDHPEEFVRHSPREELERLTKREPLKFTGSKVAYQTLATGIIALVLLSFITVVLGDDSEPVTSQTTISQPSVSSAVSTPSTQPPPSTTQAPTSFTKKYTSRESVPFEQLIEFGTSVQNRPLSFIRRGTPGKTRVMIVGAIHGDEIAGLDVVEILKKAFLGTNIDLWIVPTMNPDGIVLKTRQNANKVDLNRNFPQRWEPIGKPGFWQYSGPSAASEPETRAMQSLGELIKPQLTIWYHQNYFRISPATGREGQIRKRYAQLVDLPLLTIVGGRYTGTGAQWTESVTAKNGVGFTVEFGDDLRENEAQKNADAIFTIVEEFFD